MSKHIRTPTYQEPLRVQHLTQGCLGVQIGVAKQINDRRGNDTLQWTVRPFSKMEVQTEPLTDRSLHASLHSRRHGNTHSSASANRATPWVPRSAGCLLSITRLEAITQSFNPGLILIYISATDTSSPGQSGFILNKINFLPFVCLFLFTVKENPINRLK